MVIYWHWQKTVTKRRYVHLKKGSRFNVLYRSQKTYQKDICLTDRPCTAGILEFMLVVPDSFKVSRHRINYITIYLRKTENLWTKNSFKKSWKSFCHYFYKEIKSCHFQQIFVSMLSLSCHQTVLRKRCSV